MPRLRPPKDGEDATKVDPKTVVAVPGNEAEVLEIEEPEIEVEVEEPEVPQQDDATIALKKQIDELKKSEQVHKDRAEQFAREREEALERARQREAQISKVQKEAYDSQADAISSALAAAQAEADKAQLDIENAISLGDAKGQAEAQRRMSMATANLARLQDGKEAAEARAKEPPAQTGDPIDTWGMPPITTTWLKNHRPWLTDPDKLDELRWHQLQAKRAGLQPHTKEFLEFIEVQIGEREAPEAEVEVEKEPVVKKKEPVVSAPVSRNVPTVNGKPRSGKVTLTPKEVEAARISGITPEEYAKQKLRKEEMVASGEYGEQR